MKPLTLGAGHLLSYDPSSYESNLLICVYKSLQKVRTLTGFELMSWLIPVGRSNQLSYEATDVGSCLFVSPKEPVRNECKVII